MLRPTSNVREVPRSTEPGAEWLGPAPTLESVFMTPLENHNHPQIESTLRRLSQLSYVTLAAVLVIGGALAYHLLRSPSNPEVLGKEFVLLRNTIDNRMNGLNEQIASLDTQIAALGLTTKIDATRMGMLEDVIFRFLQRSPQFDSDEAARDLAALMFKLPLADPIQESAVESHVQSDGLRAYVLPATTESQKSISVHAMAKGWVASIQVKDEGRKTIEIAHGFNFRIVYANLQTVSVKVNQIVNENEVIGTILAGPKACLTVGVFMPNRTTPYDPRKLFKKHLR